MILGGLASCGPAGLDPVELASRNAVEPEVLTLVDEAIDQVSLAPASADAHRTLAWSFEANGLFDEAARCYANVLELEPGDDLSRFHRSIVLGEIGRDEEALVELQRAGEALPSSAPVQFRLGLARLSQEQLEAAERSFDAVVAALPGAPHGYYGRGRVALRKGDPDTALTRLEYARKLAPNEPAILYGMGQAYRALGKDELAKMYLTRGARGGDLRLPDPFTEEIERRGRTRNARLARATKLTDRGEFRPAIELLDQILSVDPGDETALTNLSSVLIEAGEHRRAAAVLERHLSLYPSSYAVYHNLSLLHASAGETSKAVLHAGRAVGLAPELVGLRLQYGTVLASAGAHAQAYQQFSEAAKLGAAEAAVQRELGRLSLEQKRPSRAAQHFRAALAVEPLDPIVNLNLVIALGDAGHVDEARTAFTQMSRRVPGHRALGKAREYLTAKGLL